MSKLWNPRSSFGSGHTYGVDYYVPKMGMDGNANVIKSFRINDPTYNGGVSELTPLDADGILTGMDLDAGSTETFTTFNGVLATSTPFVLAAPFGQLLSVTPSADVGDTVTITIKGRDYLGQPMAESIAVPADAAVSGKKAFKWIEEISHDGGASNATTGTVGVIATYGLPLTCSKVLSETSTVIASGVTVDETVGTLVEADGTYSATATSGDPRGTYVPAHALDGTERASLTCVFEPVIMYDSSGNLVGGLHGVPQYYA